MLVAIAVLTSYLRQPRGAAADECQTAPRLLSIAHAGYLLVAVVSFSGRAVAFYLVAYLLMTLLASLCWFSLARPEATNWKISPDFPSVHPFSPSPCWSAMVFARRCAFHRRVSRQVSCLRRRRFGSPFRARCRRRHHRRRRLLLLLQSSPRYLLGRASVLGWQIVVSPLTRVAIIVMIAGTFLLGVYPQPISTRCARQFAHL